MRGGESEWRSTAPLGGSRTTRNSSRTATTPRPGVTWRKSGFQDRHRLGHTEPLGLGKSEVYKGNSGPKASNPQQQSVHRQALSLHPEGGANATKDPFLKA